MAMGGQYVNMFYVSLEVLDAGAHINPISFIHTYSYYNDNDNNNNHNHNHNHNHSHHHHDRA